MRLHLAALLSLSLLAACSGSSDDAPTPDNPDATRTPVAALKLKQFAANCSDFLDYTADALTEQYLAPYACYSDFAPCPIYAGAPGSDMGTGGTGGSTTGGAAPTPERVSETNVQEEGVDEADIVKADAAGRLYVISSKTLSVLEAFPPEGLEQRELATLSLAGEDESFYAGDFFIDEPAQRLVIMATSYSPRPQNVNIFVDISNPAQPVETARLALDGYSLESRRIGNRVHRISRYDVPTPSWFYNNNDELAQKRQQYQNALARDDLQEAERIKAEVRAEIGERVDTAGAEAFLPRMSAQLAGESASESPMACNSIAHPEVTTAMGMALIDSFSTGGVQRAASGVINNAYLVYGSANSLYLTQSSFGWFFEPGQTEQTAIYRLALSSTGAAEYKAVNTVDGSVINRYAMSEHEGVLRVASTQTIFDAEDPQRNTANHVSLFNATDASLSPVGAVRGLAPGERIQGARFIGERGYVVTFRQVDPLFALDLSNPAQPAVTDELKIPGFSSYLMPLGSDYLLTIGRAGDDQQLNGQVAIQLFDVRDPHDIRQVASASPSAGANSYSYSTAEYDPHAFSYFPDSTTSPVPGTLSVPLQTYDGESGAGFSGFVVMRVNPAATVALQELGRVTHADFAEAEDACPENGGSVGGGGPGTVPCRDAVYYADPRRSLFMQDANGTYLYTVSSVGIKASEALNPETELGRHALPYDEGTCCFVID